MVAQPNRVPVTLSTPQIKWLRETSDALGLTVQEIIRRIIDEYRFKPQKER